MNNKQFKLIVGLCAAVAGLVVAYLNFQREARYVHYDLFDFTRTVSWEQKDGNIFRTASRGNYDMFLRTREDFQDANVQLNIINPRECGLIFNYLADNQFDVLYFDVVRHSVLWLKNTPEGSSVIKRGVLPAVQALPAELDIRNGAAKFLINGQVHSQIEFERTEGSLLFGGLMIKDAGAPKVIFNDVRFKGRTAGGMELNAAEGSASAPRWRFVLAVFFLCAMMCATAALSARLIAGLPTTVREAQGFQLTGSQAALIHFMAAVLLFLPLIFRQEILVSSGDNLGQIFPLFFFSKQNFTQILSGGGPVLWNPYAHNGVPFFSNHWNMTYYPLNWPVFFLHDLTVLQALTLRTMLEVFLIGFLGYRLFLAEIGSHKWAVASALAYQIGSFLIFSFTLFPVTSLFFAMTLYLYTLWTMPQRKDWLNAVMLTGSVILILTGGNMAFVFYGGLSVAVATIYRLVNDSGTRKRIFILFGSLISGFLISAIRIIPCIFGVSESNRVVEHFYTLHDRATMFVRFFVPEIVGWLGSSFLNALTSPQWNFIYEQADLPSNSQNTFFAYFGIVPAVMLLSTLLIKAKGKLKFWKYYFWISVALGLMIQPLWGMFNILTFPFNHYSYYIIILPLGAAMLTGLAGTYWDDNGTDWDRNRDRLAGLVLAVQILIVVMLTYLFPKFAWWGKWIILALAGWWIGLKTCGRYKEQYGIVSRILLQGLLWIGYFYAAALMAIQPVIYKEFVLPSVIVPIVGILLVGALAVEFFRSKDRRFVIVFCFVVPIAALAAIEPAGISHLLSHGTAIKNYIIDMTLAQVKFLVIAVLVFAGWAMFRTGKLGIGICGKLLIAIVLLDLLAFNYRFDNVVAPSRLGRAFHPDPYPYMSYYPLGKASVNNDYRFNSLDRAQFQDNEHIMKGIRSYAGIIGHMPQRFSNFIVNFGYPKRTVLIYPSESTSDPRFLDLCAVGYDIRDGNLVFRDSALSRLMLFTDFEVLEDDEAVLQRLKDPGFVPQNTVLLSRRPGDLMPVSGKGQKLQIMVPTKNQVAVTMAADSAGVLLFAESFDEGWRAYVDGLRVDIIPANYAFMAIPVEKGEHAVVFRYEPPLYTFALTISVIGLLLFGLFKIYLLRKQ